MRKSLGTVASVLLAATAFLSLAGNGWGQAPERYVVVDFATALARIIDPSTNTEVSSIRTGASPNSVVISPNHRLAFVANLNSDYISVLDLVIGAEIKRIRNVRLAQLAMSADGQTVVGTAVGDDGITVIDAETLTVKNHISVKGQLGGNSALLFSNPVIIGNNVYLNSSADVGIVNLSTGMVTDIASTPASFTIGFTQQLNAATPDGRFVLAARQGALLVIDVPTSTVVATVAIPGTIALSVSATRDGSDPNRIFGYLLRDTGFDRRFDILDLNSGSATLGGVVGELVIPGLPTDFFTQIAPNSDGSRAYLTIGVSSNSNISVVDTSAAVAPVLLSQASIGIQARSITADIIQGPPLSSLTPLVTATTPLVTNDLARTIQISGSGFAPDAQVRVGTLDPVASQFISSSLLQVTIPQSSPAQQASIIVTNPNHGQSATFQNLSAILPKALIIASPPTFRPGNQVGVANFGDSTFSVLNTGTNETPAPSVFAGARALGFAITPDGSRAYIESLSTPGTVSVFNFATRSIESAITLDPTCTAPGQTRGIALGPRFGTGQLTAYVVCTRRAAGQLVQDLYMINADPSSPTFNTVNRIPTGAPRNTTSTGPIAVTPDGHFVFIGNFGTLIVLDLSNGFPTAIPSATIGISPGFQPNLELSPDGRFLASNSSTFTSILVFDITSPSAPALVATVRGTTPLPGFPRIVGSRLYSFDNTVNTVVVFNFNPAQNDFAELATFVVPGTLSEFGAVFDVTPDGKLLYLPMREEDSVAVLDVDKIVAHDPTALLTKVGVGIAPSMAVIRPGSAAPGTISVATNNAAATFTISDGAGHTFSGSGTTFRQSAPAGGYTIIFSPVTGFTTPDSQTQSLLSGGSISFIGTYKPRPPQNLHATVGNAIIYLDWAASSTPNIDGYNIYIEQFVKDHFVAFGTVNAVGVPFIGTNFTVTGQFSEGVIANGELYRFHLTTARNGIESSPSNSILARPGQFALSQPPLPPAEPILFLHGINSSAQTWDTTSTFLVNDLHWKFGGTLSYASDVDPRLVAPLPSNLPKADFYTADFGQNLANYSGGRPGILHQADEVRGFINKLNASGIGKINIVAHSMGGLAARSFIADNPAEAIARIGNFVTYGSPHWGVPSEELLPFIGNVISEGARDLQVDCTPQFLNYSNEPLLPPFPRFLDALRNNLLPGHIRYFSIRGNIQGPEWPFLLPPNAPCLSSKWDGLITVDSADFDGRDEPPDASQTVLVPKHAPPGQIPITLTQVGLLTTDRNHTRQTNDFSAILCALELNCVIYQAHSPIDIEVTAPDSRTITRDLTEIPGASYMEVPEDGGGTSATVLLPFPLSGTYSVKVVPKPGAAPTDTFSLDVTRTGVTTVLAQNQSVQSIPAQPYVVTVLPPITIDIKPGSNPNSIKLGSGGKIPVAILSTANFNAPARVDASTLSFGHFGNEQSLAFCNQSGEDVNRDGLPDLVCHFFTEQTGFVLNDAEGVLRGKTKVGVPFVGTDSVRIIP